MSPAPVMEIKTGNGKNEGMCCSCCKSEIKSLQTRVVGLEKALNNVLELLKEKNGFSNDRLLQESRAEVITSTTGFSKRDTSVLSKSDSVSRSFSVGTATSSCKQNSQFEANISSSIDTSKLSTNDSASESLITETATLSRKRKHQPEINRSSSADICELSTDNTVSENFFAGTATLSCKRKNLSKAGTPSSTDVVRQNHTKNQTSESNSPSISRLGDKLGIFMGEVQSSSYDLFGNIQGSGPKNQLPTGKTPVSLLDDKFAVFISEAESNNINFCDNAEETSSQTCAESSLGSAASIDPLDNNFTAGVIEMDKENVGTEVISTPEINFFEDGNGSSIKKTSDVHISSEVQPGASLKRPSCVPEANDKLSGSCPVIVGEPVHIDLKDFLTPTENKPAEPKSIDIPGVVIKVEPEFSPMDEEDEIDCAGAGLEQDSVSEQDEECPDMPASDSIPVIVGEPVHVNPKDFLTTVENDPAELKSSDATITPIKVKSEYVSTYKDNENCLSFENSSCPIKEGRTEELNDETDSTASEGTSTNQCADSKYEQTNVNSPKGEVSEEEESQSSIDSFSTVSYDDDDDDGDDDDDDDDDETSSDDSDESFGTTPVKAEELTCTLCGAQFTTKSTLKRHERNHNLDNQHPCRYCTAAFRLKSDLSQHLSVHLREEPFSCQEVGSEERVFSCRYCPSVFETDEQLMQHYIGIHLNEKPFSCSECHAKFWTESQLSKHSLAHSKKKIYRCANCNACLKTKQGLRLHLNAHLEEDEFACDHCDATFKHQVDFQRHSQIARCWLLRN